MKSKIEFGDWQTNDALALDVCKLLYNKGLRPQVVIEPTCGKGAFIKAAIKTFDTIEQVIGIEINNTYIEQLNSYIKTLDTNAIHFSIYNANIFNFDFSSIKQIVKEKSILILGNPPWVTNSQLGIIGSNNLPHKSNIKGVKGLDAITGKGNFDIAEHITYALINAFAGTKTHIAFLIKNSVIKNIVYAQPRLLLPIEAIEQHKIDAQKEFGVAVSASLFCCKIGTVPEQQCTIFDLYTKKQEHSFGWENHKFVSNIASYQKTKKNDGKSPFEWRSGVKHDCSKIMELKKNEDGYINGLGEIVDVEQESIFPLIKSSDIKSDNLTKTNHYVIITQRLTTDNTEQLKFTQPKLYKYLLQHETHFTNRQSAIYKNKPRFCLFGIGKYSFKPYKVVISSLYKQTKFAFLDTIDNKPVMVDDTCYMLGFDNKNEALLITKLLNAKDTQDFIQSISFDDDKRVITKELLMRISIDKTTQYPDYQQYKHLFTSQTLFDYSNI